MLILDDPFSALDKPTEAEIFRQLRILAKDSIVLLISHRLYLFPQLDRVLWMENGTVTAGTHEELLQKVPAYRALAADQEGGKTVRNRENIRTVLLQTVQKNVWLSLGIVLTVVGAVVSARAAAGAGKNCGYTHRRNPRGPWTGAAVFRPADPDGLLESARGSLLTVFGQKITHGLRSCMMAKLPRLSSGALAAREPGELASRFVGDVDTVENLFSAGIISMFADLCKIVSILIVLSRKNPGLCLVLLCLLPPLFFFTRYVQKNMLRAQIANRQAVGRASAFVPHHAAQYPHRPRSGKGALYVHPLR